MNALALAFATAAVGVGLVPAHAAETRYIDDRSTPAAIVTSLYNAISRKEYARAWDYFGETKPAKDFDTFVKGYEKTAEVNVLTGNVASEGAAGSTFYYLPVAIVSHDADGREQTFAGCYTARLANPQIQGTPFQPLHLEKGSLAEVKDTAIDDAIPKQCPDAPAPDETDALLDKAKTAFAATHTECDSVTEQRMDPDRKEPEAYLIQYSSKDSTAEEPEQEARLFRFFCSMGAYNETHIYYLFKEIEGLQELHFAAPELDIRHENDDFEGKVESVSVIGFQSDPELVNSFYDEASKSITSHAKWRAIGDASSSEEMVRLKKSCRRLVWLNPLLRFDGFEPRARGVMAMLPHVDEFRPVHNLNALGDLCASLDGSASPAVDPRRWMASRMEKAG